MKMKKIVKTSVVALVVIALNLPIIIMINTSLQTYQQTLEWPPQWFTAPFQWGNYADVIWGEYALAKPLTNSLIISVSTMLISTITALFAAYGLSRFDFTGRKLILYIILMTQMLSSVLLASSLYVIFDIIGILDTRLSLIIANTATSLPMSIWLMYTYLRQIPIYLEEAGRLEGASRGRVILEIILPAAMPGIITVAIFAFISSWGDIVFARMSILTKDLRPVSMALMDFEDLYQTRWDLQMAASAISSLPIFILFLYVQKYLGTGLANTGGKG